jgi:hypothetical protein
MLGRKDQETGYGIYCFRVPNMVSKTGTVVRTAATYSIVPLSNLNPISLVDHLSLYIYSNLYASFFTFSCEVFLVLTKLSGTSQITVSQFRLRYLPR